MRAIVRLAMLDIPDEELDALTADMAGLVAFADKVRAVPVCASEEAEQAGCPLRADGIRPSADRGVLLTAAGGGEDGFFPAPAGRGETP